MENETVDCVCNFCVCDKVCEWIKSTKPLFEMSTDDSRKRKDIAEEECGRPTKQMQL